MKIFVAIVVSLAILIGGFLIFAEPVEKDQTAPVQETAQRSNQLSFDAISDEIQSGSAYFYDVRTPEEYEEGYIESAVNFPLQDIQAGKYPDVSKDSKLYIYCRSGNRSAEAKSLLEKAGFSSVVDLGGYADVQKIGGQMVN